VDTQICDESQDFNRMQQELMYRAGERLIFVGDEHQAIYGFAGADSESMKRMAQTLAATDRGLDSVPLTVTRRCGKAIVEEAKRIVPDFEAHESNSPGHVFSARYPKGRSGGEELKWEETYLKHVELRDMILCRVNAPLVSQCFKFLRRKIPANIQGRKIGEGLINMIARSKARNIEMLSGWLGDWLEQETAIENRKKFPSEDRIINLQDKHDCLMCFVQEAETVEGVKKIVEDVFTDSKDGNCVRLASIHKSKGLEAKRVCLLEPEGATVPHPMAKSDWQIAQEWNLRYVAITRAIEELVYVR
jgi:DNA helicase-2/ATP-dependent DNA helicase PcrA